MTGTLRLRQVLTQPDQVSGTWCTTEQQDYIHAMQQKRCQSCKHFLAMPK